MSASNLPRTIAARVCGYAIMGAIVLGLSASCGSKSGPTPVTTSVATTTVATTTTVPTTTTVGSTSTTTTSIAGLDARIDIQDAPCIAPGSGPVSCTFTAAGTTGGRTPYTFNWRVTNFANSQVVTGTGQNIRPELGCTFLAGVATFNVRAEVTARDSSNPANTNTDFRDIQITRAAGACGT